MCVCVFQAMDPQKDIQPPKQQPMIYICGGNNTLHAFSYVCHAFCVLVIYKIMSFITMQAQSPSYNLSLSCCVFLLLCFRVSHRK